MNRGEELWNDEEIVTTPAVPCTIRTAVGREIWSKLLGKTSMTKLVNKCHVGIKCQGHEAYILVTLTFNFKYNGSLKVYLSPFFRFFFSLLLVLRIGKSIQLTGNYGL